MADGRLLVFGYVADPASRTQQKPFVRFAERLATASGLDIQLFEASTYEEIRRAVVARYVDFAWLPPIPFVTLQESVVPIAHLRRGGSATFASVILVARGSTRSALADLRGARMAWVDRDSASGYAMPRVAIAAAGLDPRGAFGEERFRRSHAAVVRAIAEGRADAGATYAGFDANGAVTRGPWVEADAVRVLARAGDVPGDVVAARASLEASLVDTLAKALFAATRDGRSRVLASAAFGVDEFCPFAPAGYDAFRATLAQARERGLL